MSAKQKMVTILQNVTKICNINPGVLQTESALSVFGLSTFVCNCTILIDILVNLDNMDIKLFS